MIRVLHLVTCMDRAGQETLIMNVYRNIDRTRIQFDFLCTSDKSGDYDSEIKELGGRIHYLPSSKIKIPHLYNLGIIYNYWAFYKNYREYKIIHIHNYHAYSVLIQLLGAKCGKVKEIIVHSHNTDAPHPLIHKMARLILKLFNIHRFACSKDAGIWMFGQNSNFQIIKNGITPGLFKFNYDDRNRLRDALALSDKKVILHIGRFNYQKNHKFLIDVFEKILDRQYNAHLLLVGRGELEDEIKKIIIEKKIEGSVSFLGIRTDIPALFSASDLFLFPSLFEGLSVVLVEAQASGIRILTTSNLAKETILCGNVTQLSTEIDSEVWAQKALELMGAYDHKNIHNAIQEAGFDIGIIAKKLSQFYEIVNA